MVKNLITLVAITFLFFSCNKKETVGYEINGTAVQFAEKDMLFLEAQNDMELMIVDTAFVEKGKFHFEGKQESPELYFISIKGQQGKLPVILENGIINMTVNKDSIQKSTIGGTFNNDELQKFKTNDINQVKVEMKAYERMNNQKMIEANQSGNLAVMAELQKGYQEFLDRIEVLNNKYIDSNPTSYVSVLLLEDMLYNPTSDIQKIKKQFNNLSADLKKTKKGIAISDTFTKMSQTEVGNTAPNFTAPNPDKKPVSLSDIKGKLILIDFWASWCKPCREESSHLVKIYKDFNPLGLQIISVSLDQDDEKWKTAIREDQLAWNHVSNLQSWNEPIAKLYHVKSIPATFLVDQKGIIIAKDLRQDDLYQKIKEILKKE